MNRERILLHACCGPCAEYPARALMAEGFALQGFFYNPNIHPLLEHNRRRDNLLELAKMLDFPVDVDPDENESTYAESTYDETPWQTLDVPERCRMCYHVRLNAAAKHTAALGLSRFTTTLLISPYQDHAALQEIGEAVSRLHGVAFLYRDFRPHFQEGQQQAKLDGLYRQKYCGCIRSLEASAHRAVIWQDLADLADLTDLTDLTDLAE